MKYYSAIKIKGILDKPNNKDESQNNYAERKKPNRKICADSAYTKVYKMQSHIL